LERQRSSAVKLSLDKFKASEIKKQVHTVERSKWQKQQPPEKKPEPTPVTALDVNDIDMEPKQTPIKQ
jgi:hypothetical protein